MSNRSRRNQDFPHQETFWTGLSGLNRHFVCLALLLVVAVAFFSPVVLSGKVISASDTVNWRGIAEAMIQYRNETGNEPLWAPNLFGGMPGYLISFAHEIPQLNGLADQLKAIAWPASHLFLLGMGTYFLVFFLTGKRRAGLVSAFAAAFTSYIPLTVATGHNTKFMALAYAPYLVLAIGYTIRNPRILGALFVAAALALNLRAKHPQITYHILFLAGIWWVGAGIQAYQREDLTAFGKSTGYLALGGILGLLMVAQPYWSILEYKQFTTRGSAVAAAAGGEGGLGWSYAMRWSQGPAELLTLLVADAFGGSGNTYWGPKPMTAGPHYIGGVIIALAALALWRVRTTTVRVFGVGAGLTALFALGRHFPLLNRPMFNYFPYFDSFRAPETWLVATAFALAVLAGFGVQYLLDLDLTDDSWPARTRSAIYTGVTVLGVVAVLWIGQDAFFSYEKPGEAARYQQYIAQKMDTQPSSPQVQQQAEQILSQVRSDRRDQFVADAFRTMVVLGLGMLLVWGYREEKVSGWMMTFGLAALVVVDLWGVDKRFFGQDTFQNTELERQIPEYGFDKFIKSQVEQAGGPGHFRTLPLALNPMNNGYSSYHYQSIGGYHGAKLQRFQNYVDHMLFRQGQNQPNENAIDLLNTRYIIARQPLQGTKTVYKDEQTGLLVLENQDYLPRAFFVGQTEVISSDQATWQRLSSPSFDPRTTAILPHEIDFQTTPIDSASTTTVTLEHFSPPEIRWSVQTDAPRLMVASEIYYPAGWNAYVDGEEVPIYRVDYLLRGIPVPEGEHTVTMRFQPVSYVWGTRIAGIATTGVYGGIIVILALGWWRREQRDASDADSG